MGVSTLDSQIVELYHFLGKLVQDGEQVSFELPM